MKVVKYDHDRHYEILKGWLAAQHIGIPPRSWFSDCGFVVNDVAIGFLFTTNSKTCIIDHVAGDPKVSQEVRGAALNFLYDLIVQEAKNRGFELISGLANLESMKNRFALKGFHKHGNYDLFYRTL